MSHFAVHWSEGMFLRPHHFQAADRHWREEVSTSQQWDNPYNYGLHRCAISSEALANYQLEVSGLQCRLRDGTLFKMEEGQPLDRRDLKEAFERNESVMAHLAIPKLALGQANVFAGGDEDPSGPSRRYFSQVLEVQDQSSGGNDEEIELIRLNARLMLSTEDMQGYETIPVARIKRSGATESTPELDRDYFPPLLAIDAWPALGLELVRSIYDLVSKQISILQERVLHRNITWASADPDDIKALLTLHALNQGHAVLHNLAFPQGVHPLLAYRELSRIVGSLALFGDDLVVGEIPRYDHDDLAKIFRWIYLRLKELLLDRGRLQYEQRFFTGTKNGMEVSIDGQWLHDGWLWFVGVHGANVKEEVTRTCLEPGRLAWKLGSTDQVDKIFRYGLEGVQIVELQKAPPALPAHLGWCYYEIVRDGIAWQNVSETETLAFRVAEEFIGNLEQLPGKRNLEVVLPNARERPVLQFALFAVPPGMPS